MNGFATEYNRSRKTRDVRSFNPGVFGSVLLSTPRRQDAAYMAPIRMVPDERRSTKLATSMFLAASHYGTIVVRDAEHIGGGERRRQWRGACRFFGGGALGSSARHYFPCDPAHTPLCASPLAPDASSGVNGERESALARAAPINSAKKKLNGGGDTAHNQSALLIPVPV